jgi:hypothetical protein
MVKLFSGGASWSLKVYISGRISRLTIAVAVLAIVISVAYLTGKKGVSSGFAIGALVVVCWTVLGDLAM